jgi:hypothetical protein
MLDSLVELVGIKSGLALRREDAVRLLDEEGDRVSVLPDSRTSSEIAAEHLRERFRRGELRTFEDYLDDETPLPPELSAEHHRRFLLNRDFPETRSWDGVIPLSDLFEREGVPDGATGFFDQRYIDYLSAQGQDLQAIHWRQFEHLTAEFFARSGYDVEITPPRVTAA